jgi:hypothetical protein
MISGGPRISTRNPLALRSLIRSPGDLWLAVRMLAWALALPLLVLATPLPRLARLVTRRGSAAERSAAREGQIVALAQRLFGPLAEPGGGCLSRSLLLYRFLGAAGARPRLAMGVRKQEGRVVGHAWVAVDGRVVGESEEAIREYRPIFAAECERG